MQTLQFDLDPEEAEVFCQEADELLQQLDADLLDLERASHDPAIIQRIFRVAHTLKGSAGTIAHHRMANLTHSMETVLDMLRQDRLDVSHDLVDLLLQAADVLRLLNQEVSTRVPGGVEVDSLIQRFQDIAAEAGGESHLPASVPHGATVPGPSANPADGRGHCLRVTVRIEADSIAPAARALQVILALSECGSLLRSEPSREIVERGDALTTLQVVVATDCDEAALRQRLSSIGELLEVKIAPEPDEVEAANAKALPVDAATLDTSLKTVRTSVERLDKLMNLVGELVTDRNRLLQTQQSLRNGTCATDVLGELGQAVTHIASITDELQEEVMRARMLPLERVFRKFPRTVRDLAREMGKDVTLEIEGQDTELDRSVIEQIADPLLHLLRNALDHGIEPPEQRRALGKPANGRIRLAGRSEGNHIVITVEDDGHGIDLDAVRTAAISRGLVSQDAAARLSDSEVIDLIFAPGLSTARLVTDLSGRGVGMDVVLHQVERLHGTVRVHNRPGQGSSFELSLPLTLAIMPVLLVALAGGTYCIPLSAVTEVIEVNASRIHQVDRGELILWRNRLLPLLHLRRFFRLAGITAPSEEDFPVVVVSCGDEYAGLIVDDFLGQQEIVIKNLGTMVGGVPGITGATILGDGSVALIIDVPGLTNHAGKGC